jgi:hypothetical protein
MDWCETWSLDLRDKQRSKDSGNTEKYIGLQDTELRENERSYKIKAHIFTFH